MIEIWVDGSSKGNPGNGGWGVLIKDSTGLTEISGYKENATNNEMELLAAIKGLRAVSGDNITIYTDSQYVQKGITEWIDKWKSNGWKTANRKPVKNKDLWIELDSLNSNKINWQWVKGHDGNPGNEIADLLASNAADLL